MFNNKAFVILIILILGFCCLEDVDKSDEKKLDYEEINNIIIINE